MALYVIVLLLAIYKFPDYKDSPLKFLPFILLFTVVTEYLGLFVKKVFQDANFVIYNIYYLLYFLFFLYVFLKVIRGKKFKRCIEIGIGLFVIFYLRDLIFTNIYQTSFALSYIVGALVLIFCIILYYIEILQSSQVLIIKNDLLFWISVGLFLFYIGYLPIKILRTWFYEIGEFFLVLLLIQYSLITVMYVFFLIGFLWMKKKS